MYMYIYHYASFRDSASRHIYVVIRGLSTLCTLFEKTFPGPGYLRSEDGVV